ncbi:MAG TPA: zinc ribbon domain-containing protein [Candidatus Aphodovivens excrementavium]|nr:zinc ribbon domain-containing protein [Candidatus Aphodovivens excrementavium]
MFCIKCGSEIPSGAAFCTQCGTPVNEATQVTPPAGQAVESDTAAQQAASAQQVAAQPVSAQPAPPSGTAQTAATQPAAASAAPAAPAAAQRVTASPTPDATSAAPAAPTPSASGEAAAKKLPVIPIAIGAAAVVIIAAIVIALAVTGVFGSSNSSGVAAKGSVNDYTWAELSAISDEIGAATDENAAIEIAKKYNLCNQDGTLDGNQRKDVTLTNGLQTSVQIVGFAHDDKSDGSGKAGITFMFTDAIAQHKMNSNDSNAGGWVASEMRKWLSGEGAKLLPNDLLNAIAAVDKDANGIGKTGSSSSIATTSDKLWLYSSIEVAGTPSSEAKYANTYGNEGTQYLLFRNQSAARNKSNSILAKKYEGEFHSWYLRSAYIDDNDRFIRVDPDGNPSNAISAKRTLTVVPGFCL